ncbi:MAG: ParB N-terminal domain-containing protein [Lachnospiraceae bacterium]|nr:ParB N-terminal domain-containing protein [Lachnospiraceae bacterium]
MKYGTLTQAKAYHDNGKIEEWLQLFLRNDGKNIALADGLLLEKREYFGLQKLNMSCFEDIKDGAPEYLTAENDIEYFFWIIKNMKNSLGDWDVPPLIVEYREDKFFVNDGRHRLEMYRQLGAESVDVILWTTGEANKKKLLEVLG